jgi:predicted nucleic acid-binding Zn ribbon protein
MGMQEIKVTYTTVCKDCGETFTVVSTTGPVNICQPCAMIRIAEIFAMPGDLRS